MTEHPNAAIARQLAEAFRNSDMAAMDALLADDIVWHGSARRAASWQGRAARRGRRDGLPDQRDDARPHGGDDDTVDVGQATATRGGGRRRTAASRLTTSAMGGSPSAGPSRTTRPRSPSSSPDGTVPATVRTDRRCNNGGGLRVIRRERTNESGRRRGVLDRAGRRPTRATGRANAPTLRPPTRLTWSISTLRAAHDARPRFRPEDAVAEAFARLLKEWRRGRRPEKVGGWLMRVTANVILRGGAVGRWLIGGAASFAAVRRPPLQIPRRSW